MLRKPLSANSRSRPEVYSGVSSYPVSLRQLLDVGAHQFRAQRAVQAYRDRARVAQGIPEGFRRLPGERAPGLVGDGARDDHREPPSALLEQRLDGEDRRLGVERVEDGLEQDEVGSALGKARERLAVGRHQLVEIDVAETRIVDFGRDRRGLVGRPEHAGDESRLAGIPVHVLVRRLAGELGRGVVQLVDMPLKAVVRLRRRVRVESICLDDVGAGCEVLGVNLADHLGPGQREQVVVAPEVARGRGEALAAEIGLREPVALDGRAHRAVQYQDAAPEQGSQFFGSVGLHGLQISSPIPSYESSESSCSIHECHS